MNRATTKLEESLTKLGFSLIETQAYVFLLREGSATGYRISHGIGKPTANTYKAISTLQEKSAVLVDEGEKRLIRAVPPGELFSRLERDFSKRCNEAEELFSAIEAESIDDRVWKLNSQSQVYERARAMIRNASEIILADVFPDQMKELRSDFDQASARGVKVYVVVYEDTPGASFNCSLGVHKPSQLAWPGNQLNLVTDALEHLLCMFTPDNLHVHQAIWSNCPYLSCLQHNHLCMEIVVKSLSQQDQDKLVHGPAYSEILLSNANPPGLRQLIRALKPGNHDMETET